MMRDMRPWNDSSHTQDITEQASVECGAARNSVQEDCRPTLGTRGSETRDTGSDS